MKLENLKFTLLVLLILMGQGSLLMHDINHAAEEEVSDCQLCIKLDKQDHSLPSAGLPEFNQIVGDGFLISSTPRVESSSWQFHYSRAPPLSA